MDFSFQILFGFRFYFKMIFQKLDFICDFQNFDFCNEFWKMLQKLNENTGERYQISPLSSVMALLSGVKALRDTRPMPLAGSRTAKKKVRWNCRVRGGLCFVDTRGSHGMGRDSVSMEPN